VIGEDYNRLYFAQLLHHRPVLAGYYESGASWKDGFGLALDDSPERSEQPSRGYLLSDMTIDHVLGQGAPRGEFVSRQLWTSLTRALSERAKPVRATPLEPGARILVLEVVSHHGTNPRSSWPKLVSAWPLRLESPSWTTKSLRFQVQR